MSMYSKKHYEDIAAILKQQLLDNDEYVSESAGDLDNLDGLRRERDAIEATIYTFVRHFGRDNPRFSSERFLAAAGV